jgi:hypothetical protein
MTLLQERRILVFVPSATHSVALTGWLEKNALGTIRCWTVPEYRRLLGETRGAIGAILIDQASSDAETATAVALSEYRDLPILTLAIDRGREIYSLVAGPPDEFAQRVLRLLRAKPSASI